MLQKGPVANSSAFISSEPRIRICQVVMAKLILKNFLRCLSLLFLVPAWAQLNSAVEVKFVDSATGYAVEPEIVAIPEDKSVPATRLHSSQFNRGGRATLRLNSGRHTISVASAEHQPMTATLLVEEAGPSLFRFLLDPLVEPREFLRETIDSLRRDGYTLLMGFVVDEEQGRPLAGVTVYSLPSGETGITDERGYFQVHVPAPDQVPNNGVPASLIFEKHGYQTHERQFLELSPGGDWKYNIALKRGGGKESVDERGLRRRLLVTDSSTNATPITELQTADHRIDRGQGPPEPADSTSGLPDGTIQPKATATTNSTVRVPRNIRVLLSNGTTVDYLTLDTYSKHVLPAEWIAGWGNPANYPGGSNSLNAGAVAVRCYAIAKLNGVTGTSSYDICATTSCQVYNPANSSSFTDAAVNYTANWVVVNSSGTISSTEYSAENNSLGNSCGDSFTEPSTTGPVCIYDPVCTGETRSGHGRGMCQWGSAKWASGRKFPGNVTSTGSPTNGYPRRDWTWIVRHYYPTLFLVKGAPLIIGDDVKALKTVDVRACPDGSITNGVNCSLVTTKAANSTGTIIGGPQQVTVDGGGATNNPGGFTWYQVQWSDSTIGWSPENFLERVYSVPATPTNFTAVPAATNQINLSWFDASGGAADSFRIERAPAASGPWLEITNIDAAFTTYSDKNLGLASTSFYRMRAYNSGGNSPYSGIVSATSSNVSPAITATGNRTITEGLTLTVTNLGSGPDFSQLMTDFEPFPSEGSNGIVMFRTPRFSGSTSPLLDAAPDLALVTDTFVTNGNGSGHVLRVSCNFTNPSNPWLRLTTASASTFPNPVIDFTKRLRFSIYADRAIQVAVGCRETTVAAGTAPGSDGGTTGGIEWAGVTNISGGGGSFAPIPTRSIPAGNWNTVTFDFPNEPIWNFAAGNGVLSTASGLGTLEHIAIVPAAGTGTYNIYLNNISVVTPRTFTYSLAPGAPAGAAVNATNGIFTWTPTEAQGPATNIISVIATDNSSPPRTATNTFTVVVTETNSAPVLAAIGNRVVHAGMAVTFTNSASDSDIPANTLTYSLDPGAPGTAGISPFTGIFLWITSESFAGTTNPVTVRVTDNGTPAKSDTKSFSISVLPRPAVQSVDYAGGVVTINWSSINGISYRAQYKDNLTDPGWIDLTATNVVANSSLTTVQDTPGVPQRFYRVMVVE